MNLKTGRIKLASDEKNEKSVILQAIPIPYSFMSSRILLYYFHIIKLIDIIALPFQAKTDGLVPKSSRLKQSLMIHRNTS